jgi:hypothetical protein
MHPICQAINIISIVLLLLMMHHQSSIHALLTAERVLADESSAD